ncbi:hypothetical protein ACQ4M3_13445 [Leptolyngbya sp. AN03gr2]|uniref:hypothetical protein n=1 Tax=unclassified Leptolyngbya TaxID=2650499 RepID=UPI003D31B1CC
MTEDIEELILLNQQEENLDDQAGTLEILLRSLWTAASASMPRKQQKALLKELRKAIVDRLGHDPDDVADELTEDEILLEAQNRFPADRYRVNQPYQEQNGEEWGDWHIEVESVGSAEENCIYRVTETLEFEAV